ncbi:TIGR01244 family sulfur transferase [Mesorhizobium sp. BAC0120]|uniref:TIGR01244 family sulfur transferase n=1 Tax=Mesorhizobium sp. BAC0120 TaxID=3090670 RepID=UPI00298C9072|nr:TIGR01244 family sulfur transferase [Mesorhizobium sp. BAC0120]MDW6024131.1 TIGR01244 family sulfur transferase [Mesorhizobium sp. BAC0120]
MEYRPIADDYAVSGQITAEDVQAIKEAGFRSIICNRPDDEQPGQPTAQEIAVAAAAADLIFRHIPFTSGQMTDEDVRKMVEALDEIPGPVFAFCRSGARSTNIYAAAKQVKEG